MTDPVRTPVGEPGPNPRPWWILAALLALALAAVVAVVSIGDGGDGDVTTEPPSSTTTTGDSGPGTTPPATTPPTTVPTTAPAPTAAPSTTAAPATSPTTGPPTTAPPDPTPGGLPGEPFDIVPPAGTTASVIGVASNDVLNLRAVPGQGRIVDTAAPHGQVELTGRGRLLPQSIWWEVRSDGGTLWASATYLAVAGLTDDITAEVIAALGETPGAETLVELAEVVAATRASDEPPSTITVSAAPTVGDLGEITVDVVGLGDDAVRGERLHVFATADASGEGFVLRTVERTVLCGRAATADGLCV